MASKDYWYKFVERGPWSIDIKFDATAFKSKWKFVPDEEEVDSVELQWIAEDAASYSYSECDGWESWKHGCSNEFDIYTMDDEYLGSFCIEMEVEPAFYATRIEQENANE